MSNLANQLTPEAMQNNAQSLLEKTDSLLDQFQALHLSVTALAVGGFLCILVLVIATREAFSWFSKADNLRREVKRLQMTSLEIEKEVKAIKDLLIELRGPIRARSETSGGTLSKANLESESNIEASLDASLDSTQNPHAETNRNETRESSSKPSNKASNSNSKFSHEDAALEREINRKKVFKTSSASDDDKEAKQFPIVH